MSRFYGDLQGGRGMATRQGTTNSGISGHIRGWSIGARVNGYVNEDGEDEIQIAITGGSSNPSGDTVLRFTAKQEKFHALRLPHLKS